VARPNWPLFAGLAAAILLVDQITKAIVTSALRPGEARPIVGEAIRIVHGQNSGALFGLFKDNAAMFGLASLVVIGLIVVYHARSSGSLYLSVTLGLLLGGALGNVTDRLRLGYVVDFVDAGLGSWRWYTFNVADAAISGAIVLLILAAIRPSLAGGSFGGDSRRDIPATRPSLDGPDAPRVDG
jgi:signal peptidase II